jgi:catechol 2,3-dioxygenase-like lactoylglutathione lyase family enzyme
MNLDAIGLIVEDIQKTVKFYNLFGLEFTEYGEGHLEAITKSGTRLMIDSIELILKINPTYTKASGSKVVLGFKKESPQDVDNIIKLLSAYTVIKEPWDAFWGQRYASVLDPDGNQIDIFCDI